MNSAKTPNHAAEASLKAASSRRGFLGWMSMTALVGSVLLGTARHASAATVTVSNTSDVVDGDTSSITNLIATPGLDGGISLREAVLAAENTSGSDTILFAPTVTGSIVLGSSLSISDYTVITGPGAANLALDGRNLNRIITLPNYYLSSRNVSISGLTLQNGNAGSSSGGAIYVGLYRQLTLDNCTFSGNYAYIDGGAVAFSGYSEGQIDNCTFSRNHAYVDGGAVSFNGHDSGQIDYCTFSGNYAYGNGGAIAFSDYTEGHIDHCTFSGNHSYSSDGGAIAFRGYSDGQIDNSTFSGNYADNDGGAIAFRGYSRGQIDNCTFSENHTDNDGGAVFGEYGNISIQNSILSANSAGQSGGAVALYNGRLYLQESVISKNSSDRDAGGVALRSATLYGQTLTFDQNTANYNGGGLGGDNGSYIALESCTISNNEAGYGGGGVATDSSRMRLTQCTISGNKTSARRPRFARSVAPRRGPLGGAGILAASDVNLYGCTITRNDAGGGAGGMLLYYGSGAILNITDTIISGNSATDLQFYGGRIYARNSLLSRVEGYIGATYNTLLGAVAHLTPLGDYGGPTQTHLLLPGSPGVDAGFDIETTVDQRGAGFPRKIGAAVDIGATEGVASIPIVVSVGAPTVTGLSAPTQYDFTLTFVDDTGIDVSSLGNGNVRVTGPGGFSQLAVLVSVDDTTNGTPRIATYRITPPAGAWSAAANGTYAISLEPSQVRDIDGNAANARQVGSFAVGLGAAFVVKNLSDAGPDSLRDCIERANDNGNGPAVDVITFAPGLSGTITLATGPMDIYAPVEIAGPGASVVTVSGDNSARILNGNGYYYESMFIGVSGLTLSGAVDSAVSLRNVHASIRNAVFSGNTGFYGGAIDITQSTVSIGGASFNGNYALYTGGALFADAGSEMTVADTAFTLNSAQYPGGGIALEDSSLVLSRSTLSNNTVGVTGGGVALYRASAVVSDTTFSGNSSSDDGGGVGGYLADLDIERSTFSGNTARTGGALDSFSGRVQVQNSTFSGNSAKDEGGAINLRGSVATIRNSTFAGNISDSDNNTFGAGAISLGAPPGAPDLAVAGNDPIADFPITASRTLLSSNIIAGNTLGGGAASDIWDIGNAIDPASDHNLLGVDSGQTVLVNASNGNLVGTAAAPLDPQLAALADNGGPTQTRLLLPMSVAVDAGSNPGGLATDQRGTGFPRLLGSTVDIGAVEFDPVAPVAALLSAPPVTSASNPAAYDFTITFSDNVAVDTRTLDGGDILVSGPNGFSQLAQFVGVDIATPGTPRVATYRITPPGGTWDAADDGTYTIALASGQVKDLQGNAAAGDTLGTFLVNFSGISGPLDPNGDIDGDNFTNGWEEVLGSDPRNPGARPFGLNIPHTGGVMSVRRLLVDLDFSGPGKDRISIKGILPLKDVGFNLAGQIVILDVGGVVKAFTLDAEGRASNGNDSIRVKLGRKKGASFSAEFKNGDFAGSFADEHLTADTTDKSPRLVKSVFLINGLYYQSIARKRYNVKRGKLGG